MIVREMLGEERFEFGFAFLAGDALLVIGACLIVKVSRTGDVGILQRIRPGA